MTRDEKEPCSCITTYLKRTAAGKNDKEINAMPSPRRIKAEPYAWPLNAPMSAETTALVVIDMQADCKQCGRRTATPPPPPPSPSYRRMPPLSP